MQKPSLQNRIAWVPIAIVGLVLLGGWWFLPQLLISNAKLAPAQLLMAQSALRDSLARVGEALLIFWGATLVWRYLQGLGVVIEQSAQTLAAAERTTFFAAQAGETQRYASAMALLASPRSWKCVWAAFTRSNVWRASRSATTGRSWKFWRRTLRDRAAWIVGETVLAQLPADLQAIATVIGRRQAGFDPSEGHIDLHATSLARVYLPEANLAGAFLYQANLQGAILQNANLRGARLWNADLTDANVGRRAVAGRRSDRRHRPDAAAT